MNTLNLIIAKKKLSIIINLIFSTTLFALEKYLNLINYLRQYISNYTIIIKSLQKRKILLERFVTITENIRKRAANRTVLTTSTLRELNIYYQLQHIFSSSILLYYFNSR